jgi:uncharacterized caspase-like protein
VSVLLVLLVAALSVRAVGGSVRRGRAWLILTTAVGLVSFDLAVPWVWAWSLPELGAVVVSCALLGGLGGWLLLPVCEHLAAGLLHWNARTGIVSEDEVRSQLRLSAAAQEARELRQQGEAVETEAIAGRVRATFLLPEEVAGRLARDVVDATERRMGWEQWR